MRKIVFATLLVFVVFLLAGTVIAGDMGEKEPQGDIQPPDIPDPEPGERPVLPGTPGGGPTTPERAKLQNTRMI